MGIVRGRVPPTPTPVTCDPSHVRRAQEHFPQRSRSAVGVPTLRGVTRTSGGTGGTTVGPGEGWTRGIRIVVEVSTGPPRDSCVPYTLWWGVRTGTDVLSTSPVLLWAQTGTHGWHSDPQYRNDETRPEMQGKERVRAEDGPRRTRHPGNGR